MLISHVLLKYDQPFLHLHFLIKLLLYSNNKILSRGVLYEKSQNIFFYKENKIIFLKINED